MKQKRIEWIDVAKGIGILMVIAGHTFSLSYSYPLYAFHMPLFFFLSGLVFKDRDEDFISFLKSKTMSLLKPWTIILLISFIVCLIIPQWRNELTPNSILADFYTANTNTFQNSSLWYLVCFYFVLILFFLIKRKLTNVFLFCLSAVVLLWIKEGLELIPLPFHRLPFKIDSALIALFFFSIAFHYKKSILSFSLSKFRVVFLIMLLIVSVGLSVYNGWSNINSLDFGNIRLLYYPIAILGIASVCFMSQYIGESKCRTLQAFLIFYGKNSLLIFGFQSLFIRLYLLFFNYKQGHNMILYGDNPLIHQFGSFFTVSFIMSPLVVFFFEYLRKRDIWIL